MHKRDAVIARAIRDMYEHAKEDGHDELAEVVISLAENMVLAIRFAFPNTNRDEFLDLALGKGRNS